MTTSISISWHMGETGRATARGCALCIHEGERWTGYPSLDIHLRDDVTARIAAAAINGELTEALRRFVDNFSPQIDDNAGRLYRLARKLLDKAEAEA